MAELKDSGARREFETGAVRDIAEGKGRCDLLPLKVVSDLINDIVLDDIEDYIRSGDTDYLHAAINHFVGGTATGKIYLRHYLRFQNNMKMAHANTMIGTGKKESRFIVLLTVVFAIT